MTTVAAFELNVNFAPVGKGTNGGRATIGNKAEDAITAVDNGINAGKAIKDAIKENANKEEKKPTEYIQTVSDPNNPNKNEYVRKDIYNEEQKKK